MESTMSEKPTLDINQVISEVLKDSRYSGSLFSDTEIHNLEKDIFIQQGRKASDARQITLFIESEFDYEIQTLDNKKYLIHCPIRNKKIRLKPEELIRQLYLRRLLDKSEYGYPEDRIRIEYAVQMGSNQTKFADIVILNEKKRNSVDIVIEVKKPASKDGKDQLDSYFHATRAPMGVWTNGEQIFHYYCEQLNHIEDLDDIPQAHESLADILNKPFTIKNLILKDKLTKERKTLKEVILELEDDVLANAGVDVFEEVFKLIFTKLYDEYQSRKEKEFIDHFLSQETNSTAISDYEAMKKAVAKIPDTYFKRSMKFRKTGQSDSELKELKQKIQELFNEAKNEWEDIFPQDSEFKLTPSHLAVCISNLQDIKLFNSNLIVLDEAFEYLVTKSAKSEKGQYFTPRHVIDMCVLMLNPKRGEYMIDTAAGSCGFPMHTIFNLTSNLFTNTGIPDEYKNDIRKVFGIDFDEKTVRVAKTLNLIAGDGKSNVLELNTLDYDYWSERTSDINWRDMYGEGFKRLERLRVGKNNKQFKFDLLMANPPFAGAIKEDRILELYDLAKNKKRHTKKKVDRDILFIERNLDFLKPGGRMAIVLPQGRLNNITDKYIREFIVDKARILAVVELHENTFKPHTTPNTSVLFLQKWNGNSNDKSYCPRQREYPIFFAVSEKSGKDASGDYIFLKNSNGQYELDKNGHLIVDHDLHSHKGKLKKGIAEHFIHWARDEVGLSFWV